MTKWTPLTSEAQFLSILDDSHNERQIIFKHSTRCNISADAYEELDSGNWDLYYLDLLAYRSVSDLIAAKLGVVHQSPQILVIENGECSYHESHWRIKNATLADKI